MKVSTAGEDILQAIPLERDMRLRARESGWGAALTDFRRALERLNDGDAATLTKAWDYARGLQYSHPGLSADAYLAHPLRVARLVLLATEPPDAEAVIIALLHNVLEVTPTTPKELASEFGDRVAEAVTILTIDRAHQHEPVSMRKYYDRLAESTRSVQIVKVIDKLDNLFLLHLNPDPAIKTRYLDEIESEVVPMVRRVLPALATYYAALVKEVRQRVAIPSDTE